MRRPRILGRPGLMISLIYLVGFIYLIVLRIVS